ncbi:MAG: DUF4141 domain-containing protein [Bacteroidales bacterium]|nr:DUF4141 domain-containing protein [Bacteroidales bacterium]
MKKVILIITSVIITLMFFMTQARAQFVVTDPANIATSIINSANQIVQTSSTVTNVIRNFEEVKKVYNQGKEYYDKLKAVNDLVKDALKVRDAFLLVGEIGDIYVNSYQRMLNDPNLHFAELIAISAGYTVLLGQGANMLLEMKNVVNANGLSMNDSERINIINYVHAKLLEHRNVVNYYTNKVFATSYLRAQKTGDIDRVLALYGDAMDRYW